MQNWEYNYLVFPLNTGKTVKEVIRLDALNQAGQQGWELINVVPLGPNYLLYTFKRPDTVGNPQPLEQTQTGRDAASAPRAKQPSKKPSSLRDIQVEQQPQAPKQQPRQEQPQAISLQDILNSILGGEGGKL